MPAITFPEPLTEGVIVRRNSRFTMTVDVEGEETVCHCPTTGRIGNIVMDGRPCLLSHSHDPRRKTPHTVEAVSLARPEDPSKDWIGINQNAANRYVEHFLTDGSLDDVTGGGPVRREVLLGDSKLDFLVGDTYVEVKTPLQYLQVDIPDYIGTRKVTSFSATDRFVRHIAALADSLGAHESAALVNCFMYDNPGFRVIERSTNYEEVSAAVASCRERGVSMWQVNLRITPEGVDMTAHFPLGDL